jgi:hypothetical protein
VLYDFSTNRCFDSTAWRVQHQNYLASKGGKEDAAMMMDKGGREDAAMMMDEEER